MNSLAFRQGGANLPPRVILMTKIPSNHTLGQDILFVATPVVNNFERVKLNSNTQSQDGTGLTFMGPTYPPCSLIFGNI